MRYEDTEQQFIQEFFTGGGGGGGGIQGPVPPSVSNVHFESAI